MRKLRFIAILLGTLLCSAQGARSSVSIGIGLPNVSIGINLPLYPELVPVPGYPVYYATGIDGNYFFYDGMYWVYQNDNWYASSWYNGPWGVVDPSVMPLYVLRVPVGYYRQPPSYFRGWQSSAPPRWGEHWGHAWEQHRRGWDHWTHGQTPSRAPLPSYQRQYTGDRYPRVEEQRAVRDRNYRYQPREKAVRQHLQRMEQKAPAAQPSRPDRAQSQGQQPGNRQGAPQQGAPEARHPRPEHPGPLPGSRDRQRTSRGNNRRPSRGSSRRSIPQRRANSTRLGTRSRGEARNKGRRNAEPPTDRREAMSRGIRTRAGGASARVTANLAI